MNSQLDMKLAPGIHYNLGMEEYHAWKLDKANLKDGPISCSMLKEFVVNPYAWLRAEPRQPTAAMQTGSLLDCALTEPETFASRVHVKKFDNYKTKAAQQWRDEILATGGIIATEEEMENALKCAEAVRNHDVAGAILDGAQFQVGAVANVGEIPAKCLIDILPARGTEWEEHLVDYKTTSNGLDDESIRKSSLSQWRMHWQAAFYRTLFNKASTDRHCEQFTFIFQDPATREVRVVTLDDDSMLLGTRCVSQAVQEFTRCAYNGIKSRYASKASTLGVAVWQQMQEDEWLLSMEGDR